MRITGNTGVEKGQDIIINLDEKKADILSLVLISEELWHFRFERGNIDNHIRSSYRRNRVHSLA
jgi:hypothetical protein